jgi:hypothetical protein
MNRTALRIATTLALATALLAGTGCSLLDRESNDPITVTDPNGFFHFKIPATWQADISQGFVVVYAAEELPQEGQPYDDLAMFMYSIEGANETPEEDELKSIIDTRAKNREWGEYTIGEYSEFELGGRKGTMVRVTGTDGQDQKFEADFCIVRSAGKSVGLMNVAPPDKLETYEEEIASITQENWFWHFQDPEASGEDTATDDAETEDTTEDE